MQVRYYDIEDKLSLGNAQQVKISLNYCSNRM